MELIHEILIAVTNVATYFFEFAGVIIISVVGIKGIRDYITKSPKTRLNLAKGLAMGLEFKLGSEILRTVIVREFSEIAFVGGIIVLRAALSFIIHREIKHEENATLTND